MENKGHIYVDTFIDCGICGNERRLLLGGEPATTIAKYEGYVYTRKHGWVCRHCQKDKRKSA